MLANVRSDIMRNERLSNKKKQEWNWEIWQRMRCKIANDLSSINRDNKLSNKEIDKIKLNRRQSTVRYHGNKNGAIVEMGNKAEDVIRNCQCPQ